MRSEELISAIGGRPVGELPSFIVGASSSSENITQGSVFIAVRGARIDGHQFVDAAFKHGATLAVVEDELALNGRPGIVVANSRISMSRIAAIMAGNPSHRLQVVGVTGTNGKTTTNWIIFHALRLLQGFPVRIGTLGYGFHDGTQYSGALTTPDPFEIHSILSDAVARGCQTCVMEVSSHALDQNRVDDVKFDVGIFTNLTRDHLDYHGTFEAYGRAKQRLFELITKSTTSLKVAVINADDEFGFRLINEFNKSNLRVISVGSGKSFTVSIRSFDQNFGGSAVSLLFDKQQYDIKSSYIGRHNAQNIAAAFGSLIALGYTPDRISEVLQSVPPVPGRLEPCGTPEIGVYIDYAHTPDALENVLSTLRELVKNELWVVFGCGGDRDKGKRPQMAEVASRLAHRVVVTSDNPRSEDPSSIIKDILSGGVSADIVDVDRRSAIAKVLNESKKGDVVLIAGKGHEDYQIIGNEKSHFSDKEEVARFFSNRYKKQ